MADQWINAATALNIFNDRRAICERCHAGLIRSRAALLTRNDDKLVNVEIPQGFWWAEGHAALQQNWKTGDFSTLIDQRYRARAFGVTFALDDLLELIAFDQRAAIRRQLSVAGNPAWASAREARRFAYDEAGLPPTSAGKAIVEQCRLGFITARAVEMRLALGAEPDDWTTEAREWDIPTWFWEKFTGQDQSRQNWESGLFSGQGEAPKGHGWMTLNGAHFLRSSLEIFLPAVASAGDEQLSAAARLPRLPEADLLRWWDKLAAAREHLSQSQLWAVAKGDHPGHTISRDRIRGLAEGRTPGPKPN